MPAIIRLLAIRAATQELFPKPLKKQRRGGLMFRNIPNFDIQRAINSCPFPPCSALEVALSKKRLSIRDPYR